MIKIFSHKTLQVGIPKDRSGCESGRFHERVGNVFSQIVFQFGATRKLKSTLKQTNFQRGGTLHIDSPKHNTDSHPYICEIPR